MTGVQTCALPIYPGQDGLPGVPGPDAASGQYSGDTGAYSEHNEFLERAYRILNKVYFEDKLPEAVITIQSSQRAYGHITVGKVWQDNWDSYHEINISAEYLNRPVENIIATLLHECCHLYAMENNIKDTSNNYRYHNKRFKEIAEKRDLKIS